MKAIETRFIPATTHKPARVSASDGDGNRIIISYGSQDGGEDAFRKAADALAEKMGWGGELVGGATKRGYTFVFVS